MNNNEILRMIWQFKKKGKVIENIHLYTANITDAVIKYSMKKLTLDNVTVIFISFKNFENQMKDKNFEYSNINISCKPFGKEIDLSFNPYRDNPSYNPLKVRKNTTCNSCDLKNSYIIKNENK